MRRQSWLRTGGAAAFGLAQRRHHRTRSLVASRSKPDSIVATTDGMTPQRTRTAMARSFQFDVDTVVEKLNRILQMELAAVIYYTHYSFMIYGHARIPITSWLRDNATESLAHA